MDPSVTFDALPPELLDMLARESGITAKFLAAAEVERAVESIVVWTLMRDRNWQAYEPFRRFFDGAYALIWELAQREIRLDVAWIGERCFRLKGRALTQFVDDETESAASFFLLNLMRSDCTCWKKWQEFRQESRQVARKFCNDKHRFNRWNKKEKLSRFLFDAMVGGSMALGKHARPKDFRRGMLAKREFDLGGLESGPALRCGRPGCSGQIDSQNRCLTCGRRSDAREITWRVWPEGTWIETHCQRCAKAKQVRKADISEIRPLAEEILRQATDDTVSPAHRIFDRTSKDLEMLSRLAEFSTEEAARVSQQFSALVAAFNAVLDRLDFYHESAWPLLPDRARWPWFFLTEDRADLQTIAAMSIEDRERASQTSEDTEAALKSLELTQERLRWLNRRLLHVAYGSFLRPQIGCGRLWFGNNCPICAEKANWLTRPIAVWEPSEELFFLKLGKRRRLSPSGRRIVSRRPQ